MHWIVEGIQSTTTKENLHGDLDLWVTLIEFYAPAKWQVLIVNDTFFAPHELGGCYPDFGC